MTPGTPVIAYSRKRRGEATYRRTRRDGRIVVQWEDGSESACKPDDVRPLERATVSPGRIVRPYTVAGEYDAVRAVPKDAPERSRSYLEWIRSQSCAECMTRGPSEASHHVEPGHGRMGVKTSDLRTLPLCREHHEEFHRTGCIGGRTPDRTRAWVEGELAATLARYGRDVLGLTVMDVDRARVRALRGLLVETLERQQKRAG